MQGPCPWPPADNTPYRHAETPVTLRHWQLRDLLSFGRDDTEVFAVHGTRVLSYPVNVRPSNHPGDALEASTSAHAAPADAHAPSLPARACGRESTVMDMGFHASCMGYWNGYVAAGGHSGEVRVSG